MEVGSLETPDTMMVYLRGNTTPLGLIPGAVVVFYRHLLKRSKSSNVYCIDANSSSCKVLSLESNAVVGGRVPSASLTSLMDGLVEGWLPCGCRVIVVGVT